MHKQHHKSNIQPIDGQITNPSFGQLVNTVKMKELSIFRGCAQIKAKEPQQRQDNPQTQAAIAARSQHTKSGGPDSDSGG